MLGSGSEADVYRVCPGTVAKVYKSAAGYEGKMRNELSILLKMNDLVCYGLIDVVLPGHAVPIPAIAMEEMACDMLTALMDEMIEGDGAIMAASQTLDATIAMHARSIIHRDIKLENLLVQFNPLSVKISDFGLAVDLSSGVIGEQGSGIVGTFAYMAPEIAKDRVHSYKSDSYSMAASIFGILTGSLLCDGEQDYYRLTKTRIVKATSIVTNEQWRKCLQMCLEINPADRSTAATASASLGNGLSPA
jgi:serine/threonine protein kinase